MQHGNEIKYLNAWGIFIFEERLIYRYITAYLKAHKRLQFVDLGGCKLQVSKEANIQRAKVKVQRDTQNGSHLRGED